jgi:2-oxoglutarate/2-oxoacid ferredoxin oxidoreductase subunit alpha
MATTDVAVHEGSQGQISREPVVNDFSIQVATVNGSGSQSANTILLRTIFQMGVPGTPSAPPKTATSPAKRRSISLSR